MGLGSRNSTLRNTRLSLVLWLILLILWRLLHIMGAGVTLARAYQACQVVITDSGSQTNTMSLWLEMADYLYRRQNPIRTVLSRKELGQKATYLLEAARHSRSDRKYYGESESHLVTSEKMDRWRILVLR